MSELDTIQTYFVDYALPIMFFFTLAYIVHRISAPVAKRLQPLGKITMRDNPRGFERLRTLQGLASSAISIVAFIFATLASFSLFFSPDTLLWVVGLFSAAFGLGARPFISDYLTGLSFIFEDIYYVGDKIEFPMSPHRVEGIVERISLRITQVRGLDGELYTMPNGDIRLVRNFSLGDSSPTTVTLKVPASEVGKTLDHLEALSITAMTRLPNLIEPWQVISKTGELGKETELTVLAKAKFGKGAEMRTRLLALLQSELSGLSAPPNGDDDEGHMDDDPPPIT